MAQLPPGYASTYTRLPAVFNEIYTKNAAGEYIKLGIDAAPSPDDITIAAGTDGLAAGILQEALQSLATRIKDLESI